MTDIDQELAKLAGGPAVHPEWYWFKDTGLDTVSIEEAIPSADLPRYSESIDAQIRDLDPLIEAAWGPFTELVEPFIEGTPQGFEAVISPRLRNIKTGEFRFFRGEGPTRATARAAACLEALKARHNSIAMPAPEA